MRSTTRNKLYLAVQLTLYSIVLLLLVGAPQASHAWSPDEEERFLLLKQLLGMKKVNSANSAFNPEAEWWHPGAKDKEAFHYPGELSRGAEDFGVSTSGDETTRFFGIMQKNFQRYTEGGGGEGITEGGFLFPGQRRASEQQQQFQQGGDGTDQTSLYAAIQRSKYAQGGYYGGGKDDDSVVFAALQQQNYQPYTQGGGGNLRQGEIYTMPDSEIEQLVNQGFVNVASQQQQQDQSSQYLGSMLKNYGPYNKNSFSSSTFRLPGGGSGAQAVFDNQNDNTSGGLLEQTSDYLRSMKQSFGRYINQESQFHLPGQ